MATYSVITKKKELSNLKKERIISHKYIQKSNFIHFSKRIYTSSVSHKHVILNI